MNSKLFADVRARIEREMVEAFIPSVAVGVAQHGRMIWTQVLGCADLERRIEATADTSYALASISKPMTATAIMFLAEQGELDLDRPINDYLDRRSQIRVWTGDPAAVTVRRIASHTAGLPVHGHFLRPDDAVPPLSVEESIRRYGNVVIPPGERFCYSNMGYGVLGHLIERCAGESYAEFMRRHVFLPLGMMRSSVPSEAPIDDFTAVRYDEGRPIPFYDMDHRGASAVYSSLYDMLRFGMFHLKQHLPDQKAILTDASIDAMQTAAVQLPPANTGGTHDGGARSYGLGWFIEQTSYGKQVSHYGAMGGTRTRLLLFPQHGLVIAAAANTGHRLPHTIHEDVLAALLPGLREVPAAHGNEGAAAHHDAPPAPLESHSLVPLEGDWRGYVHTDCGDVPFALSFRPSGDVHAQLGEQLTTLVNNISFREQRLTGKMAGMLETEDVQRRPHDVRHHLQIELHRRGEVLNGAVIAKCSNTLSHWAELKRVSAAHEDT